MHLAWAAPSAGGAEQQQGRGSHLHLLGGARLAGGSGGGGRGDAAQRQQARHRGGRAVAAHARWRGGGGRGVCLFRALIESAVQLAPRPAPVRGTGEGGPLGAVWRCASAAGHLRRGRTCQWGTPTGSARAQLQTSGPPHAPGCRRKGRRIARGAERPGRWPPPAAARFPPQGAAEYRLALGNARAWETPSLAQIGASSQCLAWLPQIGAWQCGGCGCTPRLRHAPWPRRAGIPKPPPLPSPAVQPGKVGLIGGMGAGAAGARLVSGWRPGGIMPPHGRSDAAVDPACSSACLQLPGGTQTHESDMQYARMNG